MSDMNLIIRNISKDDIGPIADIHHYSFPNDCNDLDLSYKWIYSKYLGWPINKYYAAIQKDELIGYILWVEMGGFRKECVFELEQLAISNQWRKKGVGTQLIDESLLMLAFTLEAQNRYLKLIEVTTGVNNEAKRIYYEALNPKTEYEKGVFFDEKEVGLISPISAINAKRKKRGLNRIPSAESE